MRMTLWITILLAVSTISSKACSMVLLDPETAPVIGASGVLVIQYENTHRNCNVPMDSMQFTAKGMTIQGATSWKEIRPGVHQRKFKVTYETDSPALNIVRPCPRGGVHASFPVNE